jgi:hypothetical protein
MRPPHVLGILRPLQRFGRRWLSPGIGFDRASRRRNQKAAALWNRDDVIFDNRKGN